MTSAKLYHDLVYEKKCHEITIQIRNEAKLTHFAERNKRPCMVGLKTEIASRQQHEPFHSSRSRQSCLIQSTCLGRPEYHLHIVAINNIVFNRTERRGIQYLLVLCVVYTSSLVVDTNKMVRYVFTTPRGNIFNKITRSVLNTGCYHSISYLSSIE